LRKTRLHRAAQAQFNAAHILVYYKNPDKDYSREAREFGEFPSRYPAGTFAGEARSRLDVLRNFEQSKTNELLKEVDSFTRKMEAVTQELQKARADEEAASKERDLLLIGKNNSTRKVDDLLNDKDGLLEGKSRAPEGARHARSRIAWHRRRRSKF
jgi:hypothetical protein